MGIRIPTPPASKFHLAYSYTLTETLWPHVPGASLPPEICNPLSAPGNNSQVAKFFLDRFAFCESNGSEAGLHVISRKKLLEAAEKHSDLSEPLDVWYRVAKKAEWKNLMDVRRVFPTADAVDKFTVFNIKGNAYRLITEINYHTGRIFLRQVLTHAEYSRGGWGK
jgi:mRNA interferase HigB